MTKISPRVAGIVIVSVLAVSFLTVLFVVNPLAMVAIIATVLFVSLLVFGIELIIEDWWPWE